MTVLAAQRSEAVGSEQRAPATDGRPAETCHRGAGLRPGASPAPVRLDDVRHVDAGALPASTPAAPQEAPLPHAPKTPIPQPGRAFPALLGPPASPSPTGP